MTDPSSVPDDTPLTLDEACRIFFRSTIGPSTLRGEARRGMLKIVRIGRTDFVMAAAIRGMMLKKCQEPENQPDSTSIQKSESGSSVMERSQAALAAAKATSEALKRGSRPTSPANSSPQPGKVVSLFSPSQKS